MRIDRSGDAVDVLAWLSCRGARFVAPLQHADAFFPHPFDTSTLFAVSKNGSGIVLVDRSPPEHAEPTRFRVTRLTSEGDTVFSRDFRYRPLPISDQLIDAVARRWVRQLEGRVPDYARYEAAIRDSISVRRFFPPVSELVATSVGTIWLRREGIDPKYYRDGSSVIWWVLDPSGQLVGRLCLAYNLTVTEMKGEHVWATESRDAKEWFVVRYRLRREQVGGSTAAAEWEACNRETADAK